MEQYRISPRANFLDYDEGDFFVTICTRHMAHYFGEISDGEMHPSELGKFVETQLKSASLFNDDVEVPIFVVMPNHVHAIVCLKRNNNPLFVVDKNLKQRSPDPSYRNNPEQQRHIPALSRYISSLKGTVTKYAKSHNIRFGWQPRYHDHCIRGTRDGNMISEYIKCNVRKWEEDCFFRDEKNPGSSST